MCVYNTGSVRIKRSVWEKGVCMRVLTHFIMDMNSHQNNLMAHASFHATGPTVRLNFSAFPCILAASGVLLERRTECTVWRQTAKIKPDVVKIFIERLKKTKF
jgi:hypothetical protein